MAIKRTSITVVVHTYNEEENIEDCLRSAQLLSADIVLVDMGSSDRTVARAKKYTSQIHTFPHSLYVEPAREFGLQKAEGSWVFILDADERITEELAQEIKKTIENTNLTSCKVPRKNMFAGRKWLRHGGWWPDPQIRLIKKSAFRSWPKEIHSTPVIEGAQGLLTKPLLHFFHGDLEGMVSKTVTFEQIEADLLYKAGRPVKTITFMRKFLGELNRRLFVKAGFLDGTVGIIESIYQAFSKTITYLYLYEKKKGRTL